MAATATSLIGFQALRDAAAAALAPVNDDDPAVLADIVDSLTPPALLLEWGDPWLEPGAGPGTPTMGPCLWTARLLVVCVAGRWEPGAGIDVLEQLVTYTIDRLAADPYTWPLDSVEGPRQTDMSGIPYLATRVAYNVPTAI
jgi:hypothetical protein